MFGGSNIKSIVAVFDYDPAADAVLPVLVAPQALTVVGAKFTTAGDVAASTANYFSATLRNGGTGGTATTAMAAAVGGTPGWTSKVSKAATLSAPSVAAGEHIQVAYDEEGTGTFGVLVVQLDYVLGKGA